MSELEAQAARKSHNEGSENRPPQPAFEKQVDGILERIEKIEIMLGIVEKQLRS